MPHASFPPKGDQSSWIQGRILITRVQGSWNLEQHRRASAQMAPLVGELESSGPWASLVILTDTLLTSLEVLAAGREAVASGALMRLRALAWVIGEGVEGRAVLLPRYRRLYEGLLPTEVFVSEREGIAWLSQQRARGSTRSSP